MSDMPPPPPHDSGWSSQPPSPPESLSHSPQAMTGWATLGTGETLELASPGARLGARIIDIVIMIVVALILFFVVFAGAIGVRSDDTVTDEEAGAFLGGLVLSTVVFALVGVLYEVVMVALKGQTLGKMATSIRVVRADNGLLPGWGKSIGRWIIPVVLSLIPFVGWILYLLVYLSLTWDKVRQGWHDKAAGTLVVKV
ncbi:MAG: RDD family protein [Acidimicrobiaceae bacterium]|nr:RDD family protein [Acidimicrobiaceae bacterium]MYE76873.1 RDD family protein [Acidimicrobiaceae bacterium]MYE95885.1 RDD family protein [Acidimicrobiaceae bacterium]MYH44994.1 RDD family protein [Acidimicrobiaceae bacterium]MYI55135.1 RDD family protein [Acidimicrobiaceae bacterium]